MNKREEAVLVQAEEVIRTLRGLVELQKGRMDALEMENKELKDLLERMKSSGEDAEDGFGEEALNSRLGLYYRDLCQYNEKNLSLEDGERLYHTLKYVFDELHKWGMR